MLKHWSFSLQVARQTSAPPAAQVAWRPEGTSPSAQVEKKLLHAGKRKKGCDHAFKFEFIYIFSFVMLSSSCSAHIRPLPVFKPAGSPAANRDAELYAPYRTPPRATSSTNSSSCNSSPTSRYETWSVISCIVNNHRAETVVLRSREFCQLSELLFMSNVMWIYYKSNLSCLRQEQVDFGDLREFVCSTNNAQHYDERVGGGIKLRRFYHFLS